MIINFRARGISRGARKLTRTSTLNKKKKKTLMDARYSHSSKGLMGFRAKDSFKILMLLFLSDQLNLKLRLENYVLR